MDDPISDSPTPSTPPPTPAGPSPDPQSPSPDAQPVNQLSLDPNLSSKARGENACKPGDTYETNITVRANDQGSFDVIDIDPLQVVDNPVGPPDDPSVLDDDDEEKILGYKRPKKSMAMPSMS